MRLTTDNSSYNREHFDKVYSKADREELIHNLRNIPAFLHDVTKTEVSWHGLYLDNFAERIRDKRIFEIGCGAGLNALIMASLGAQVVANDVSTVSEGIVRAIAAQLSIAAIDPVSGNFVDLPFPRRSFDFVVGKSVLHHLTPDIEETYLAKMAQILKPDGEARFVEPSANSPVWERIREIPPTKRRPSLLNRRAYKAWQEQDHHPDRDNSSRHFLHIGKRFFHEVQIIPLGSIEWFSLFMPKGHYKRRYKQWANRMESKLPKAFRRKFARSQLIVYARPKG